MVGTKPIALPAARSALTRLCIWVASPSTSIASAPPERLHLPTPPVELLLPPPDLPVIEAKGMLGAGILAGLDLLAVPGEGRRDGLLQVRVALDELGGAAGCETPRELSYLAPPLQLDRLGAGLLQKSAGVPHPVFRAGGGARG